MKNRWMIFYLALFSLLMLDSIDAAGRGGGGGRAGGGGGARVAARSGGGRIGQFPVASPQAGARQVQQRNMNVNRGQTFNQVQQRIHANPGQTLPQQRQTFHQFQTQNLPRNQNARQALNNIQTNHPGYKNWFNNQFNNGHHYNPNIPNLNWWQTPNWNALNGWVSGDWSTPTYYSYLDQGDVQPYVIEDMPPPPPQPVAQAAPTTSQDWIPLGVFAAGKDVAQAPYSNMFVQLALSKDGEVAGAYYNAATDELHPLEGTLSKQTQVVGWTVADNPDSPLMQTGLYNLAQDETPVQLRFPNDTTQTWFLVRLQDSES
jgi:hypothetical protein